MNMKVDLCGVTLNNPVMTASGTFGAGEEYSEFVDLNRLGAVVTDTAVAPARIISIASSAFMIPPIPTIGIFTACAV